MASGSCTVRDVVVLSVDYCVEYCLIDEHHHKILFYYSVVRMGGAVVLWLLLFGRNGLFVGRVL